MVDSVLIQCVSWVCRSLSAFLLSVCMSVWSMALICMSQVVCWLFLKWYVIHVRCCVSHLLSLSMVRCVDCLVFGRHTVCGIFAGD